MQSTDCIVPSDEQLEARFRLNMSWQNVTGFEFAVSLWVDGSSLRCSATSHPALRQVQRCPSSYSFKKASTEWSNMVYPGWGEDWVKAVVKCDGIIFSPVFAVRPPYPS
ncbi:unnamed protein product [Symbiodinium natans]|uniref:Uncharacterized protein n=1 Tax=Symbiodinium natans TaxID=878477 RepID=A0A812PP43_9DINO|nr:unnamed protein product [Symbiodinium natans]